MYNNNKLILNRQEVKCMVTQRVVRVLMLLSLWIRMRTEKIRILWREKKNDFGIGLTAWRVEEEAREHARQSTIGKSNIQQTIG